MVALDIFTNKKYEDICPSTHNMDVPNVTRRDFQLIGMDDGFLSLMDDSGETREDLKIPEGDLGEEIKKAIDEERDILVSSFIGADKTNSFFFIFKFQISTEELTLPYKSPIKNYNSNWLR